jgi:NADH-quinone oxidoreductase subunit L
MFHLFTHALFKALLFLAAGSVMHAMGGVIDIRRIGGLRRRMPVTHWTFLFGCLAIAGVLPFAGFWSKDAILVAVQERLGRGNAGLFELLLSTSMFGVLLIDFYMFRPYFLVFWGDEKIPEEAGRHAQQTGTEEVVGTGFPQGKGLSRQLPPSPSSGWHAHESPGTMIVPLVILAFGALTVGAYFEWTQGFARFLAASPSLQALTGTAAGVSQEPAVDEADLLWRMGAASSIITAVGIALAAILYLGSSRKAERLARFMDIFGLYSLSFYKFFLDPLYAALVVWPLLGLARLVAWIDRSVIDGAVDFCGRLPARLGAALRPSQNGLLQLYALAMILGLLVLIGALLM